jgi:DNA-binding transcriptional regulator YhcF (GntR family)
MEHHFIKIEKKSNIPKYKQIIHSVYHAIENKALKKGDKIPSINTISKELSLSRDTVLTAFNELRARGIIASTPGKGNYVNSTEIEREQKIFLLFDELNPFKEKLYNAFVDAVKDKASVDIYFHYFNKRVFRNLIQENISKYTTYIIMPVFFKGIRSLIRKIENAHVYLLDQLNPELADDYPGIYQNFEKDIYNALNYGMEELKKYHKITLVYPGGKEPRGQLNGFLRFCRENRVNYEVIHDLESTAIERGTTYIVPNDLDLVTLVKESKRKHLKLGKDLGVISYNDTPLKEVVADGITTISTDFEYMGKTLADMVLNKKSLQMENPSSLIFRNSL